MKSMVGHIPAQLPKAAFGGHHSPVRVLLGAVDGADEHPTVGLAIVFCIGQNPAQIIVQILGIGGLVRVFGVVDHILEAALYRPESCCSDNATSFADCLLGKNRFCCRSRRIAVSTASVSGCSGRLLMSHSLEYTA